MPRPLLIAAVLPIASSICCCCCDLHTWIADGLDDGRLDAEATAQSWLADNAAARRQYGAVDTAELKCLGAFPFETLAGATMWELEFDVAGSRRDGEAEVYVVRRRRGRWMVAGAALAATGVATVDVGERPELEVDAGSGGVDWD